MTVVQNKITTKSIRNTAIGLVLWNCSKKMEATWWCSNGFTPALLIWAGVTFFEVIFCIVNLEHSLILSLRLPTESQCRWQSSKSLGWMLDSRKIMSWVFLISIREWKNWLSMTMTMKLPLRWNCQCINVFIMRQETIFNIEGLVVPSFQESISSNWSTEEKNVQ